MLIAIDGPAASGKTSLARTLAGHFECLLVETGKMYRALALGLHRGLRIEEIEIVVDERGALFLNDEDVSNSLHTPLLDRASSKVATLPEVRRRLVELQRRLAEGHSVVMEGRDIGTVVLPDADVKLFLQASPETRAARRAAERGAEDVEGTLAEIVERDERDQSRPISPLNPASDALIIDTDQKGLVEVTSEAIHLIEERLRERWHSG